jgi:hypothetical protein
MDDAETPVVALRSCLYGHRDGQNGHDCQGTKELAHVLLRLRGGRATQKRGGSLQSTARADHRSALDETRCGVFVAQLRQLSRLDDTQRFRTAMRAQMIARCLEERALRKPGEGPMQTKLLQVSALPFLGSKNCCALARLPSLGSRICCRIGPWPYEGGEFALGVVQTRCSRA